VQTLVGQHFDAFAWRELMAFDSWRPRYFLYVWMHGARVANKVAAANTVMASADALPPEAVDVPQRDQVQERNRQSRLIPKERGEDRGPKCGRCAQQHQHDKSFLHGRELHVQSPQRTRVQLQTPAWSPHHVRQARQRQVRLRRLQWRATYPGIGIVWST
jgi:hypothetical protein